MLKALLLVAGLGKRLRPITDEIPKCLLPIGGKPLLQIWSEHLCKHGINEVLINTHWHHEKVEEFISTDYADFSDYKELKNKRKGSPKVHLFYEPELLGSAGALLANKDWVADGQPFFILYGDNLTNVNLSKIFTFHRQHDLPFTLGVFKTERPRECGIAEVGEDGAVKSFVEKPQNPKSDLAAAGVYIGDERIFDFFPNFEPAPSTLDLGFHVIPRLVGRMKAYLIEDILMDIGTADSYAKAQKIYPQITPVK